MNSNYGAEITRLLSGITPVKLPLLRFSCILFRFDRTRYESVWIEQNFKVCHRLRNRVYRMTPLDMACLERKKQIDHLLEMLPSRESISELGDPRKLVQGLLQDAVQSYVQGRFSYCILQSATSLEMALLLELDKRMSPADKQKQKQELSGRALSFGKLIALSKRRGILDEQIAREAFVLHNLRSIFAHPANVIAFVLGQQDPEVPNRMLAKWKSGFEKRYSGLSDIEKQQWGMFSRQ